MKKIVSATIATLALIFISIIIYNQVLKIGLNLREQSKYLEYTFYALAAVLFFWFILEPIASVLFTPFYQISRYCNQDLGFYTLRTRAKRLKRNGNLEQDDLAALDAAINQRYDKNRRVKLANRMSIIYSHRIRQNIDQLTKECAKDVFCLTAISQNGFFDMLTVLTNSLRLIKRIIIMCGFRPTFVRTCKLYINVFASALIADGAQKIDLTALLHSSLGGILKTISNSALNGSINAFSILRVGMLTKNYLYSENPKQEKPILRDLALTDAATMLPALVISLATSPIKNIASLFTPIEKDHEQDGEAENMRDIVENAQWGWKSEKKDKGKKDNKNKK